MRVIKYLAALALVWTLFYLLGAFFATTLNITQWYEGTRFFVVFASGTAMLVLAPMFLVNEV